MFLWEVTHIISFIQSSFLFILAAKYVQSSFLNNESSRSQIFRDRTQTSRYEFGAESWIGIHKSTEDIIDDSSEPSIYDFFDLPTTTKTSLERVAFSSTKPKFIPTIQKVRITKEEREIEIYKRQLPGINLPISACSSQSDWETLIKAVDVNSNPVTVGRNQYFWITRCHAEGHQCHGFTQTSTRSSECKVEYKWQVAWGKPEGQPRYRWLHIAVPACCSCAVTFETRRSTGGIK